MDKTMKKGLGIKGKVAVMAALFMGILTVLIATVGYKLYYDNVMDSYGTYTDTVLEYAYRTTLDYSFGDMIAERGMPEGYEEMRQELNRIKDSSQIEYLYAIYFENINDIHSLHYAINAKNQAERSTGAPLSEIYTYMGRPCEEGGFTDDTLQILQHAVLSRSRENRLLDGYSDEYGHMLNGYRVIYDSEDNAVGLICVEIDINRIHRGVYAYVRTVIIIALIFTAIMVLMYIFNTEHYLVGPLLRIAKSSDGFVKKMQDNVDPDELVFEDTHISVGNEIKLLADNVERMADGVASYMKNLQNVTAEKERIGAELNIATQIQAAVLPRSFPPYPDRHEFDLYASMDPAKEVGGDFYDFFMPDDDHIALVMADVSGKGVPAALFMMISKVLIKTRTIQNYSSPSAVLSEVNEILCEGNDGRMFVTVWLAVIEISTGRGIAANAGHEHPALRHKDGSFELVKYRHSPAVATMEGMIFKEHEFELKPGDTLFVYTDGVTEATDLNNKLFGEERLLASLNIEPSAEPKALLSNVRHGIDEFIGDAPQFDDITMLAFRYDSVTSHPDRPHGIS